MLRNEVKHLNGTMVHQGLVVVTAASFANSRFMDAECVACSPLSEVCCSEPASENGFAQREPFASAMDLRKPFKRMQIN